MTIGKYQTKIYLEVIKAIEDGSSAKEIRMITGASDAYVSRIRKSLKDK